MLEVGIIGLGTEWESTYRPALEQLSDRLCVRGVYDPVPTRAEQAAAELKAASCRGLITLAGHPAVDALLILDDLWCRRALISFLSECRKLTFVAKQSAILNGQPFFAADAPRPRMIPNLSLRYSPATSRLRELMATRLGPAREIDLQWRFPETGSCHELKLAAIDWCRYLAGPTVVAETSTAEVWRLQFPPSKSHAETAAARLIFSPAEDQGCFSATVTCERGTAKITGANQITWAHAGDERTEDLSAERSGTVVLLDIFCRRGMGGIVPTPTVDDFFAAARLAEELSAT